MIEILYGTTNQAKLQTMINYTKHLNLSIIGLNNLEISIPDIKESGNNPLENATIKAIEYYKYIKRPVFSCDTGLFIKNIPEDMQPGVNVRRVNGKYLNDEETINHYCEIIESLGGEVIAYYQNAICLIKNETEVYKYMGDDISGEMFILSSKPHKNRTLGFPLDSLSINIDTGKYYLDFKNRKINSNMKKGFENFFRESLKL